MDEHLWRGGREMSGGCTTIRHRSVMGCMYHGMVSTESTAAAVLALVITYIEFLRSNYLHECSEEDVNCALHAFDQRSISVSLHSH
jgi:hypothetical protein